jgi:sulfofructose kinase
MHVDVLVAGLNVVDVLARLPDQVQRGSKHEISELCVQGGAPAGNAACAIASLGWRTGYVGYFGENTLSAIARAEFAQYGVVPDFFISDPAACPAVAIVEIDPRSGERTVFYSLANYHHLEPGDVPRQAVRQARLILVDGYESEAALAMLEAAQGTSCRSVVDVEAGDPATLGRIIALATDAILPLAAGQLLTGQTDPVDVVRELSRWTAGQIIVTDGARGSWAHTAAGVLHQPAFQVPAVDTTGCGDAFHGAYASALLDGFPLPLRMEFAAWFASRVALHVGARAGLPTLEAIRRDDIAELSTELHFLLRSAPRWTSAKGVPE